MTQSVLVCISSHSVAQANLAFKVILLFQLLELSWIYIYHAKFCLYFLCFEFIIFVHGTNVKLKLFSKNGKH